MPLNPKEFFEFRRRQEILEKEASKVSENNNKKLIPPSELFEDVEVDDSIVLSIEENIDCESIEEEFVEEEVDIFDILKTKLEYIESIVNKPQKFQDKISEIEKSISKIEENNKNTVNLVPLYESIQEVKNSIPEIPEIKYYDEEIEFLKNLIDSIKIPEQVLYDNEIKELGDRIDSIIIPEVKYYDEQVSSIEKSIDDIRILIENIPDPEVFDPSNINENIEDLRNRLEEINNSIPTIPDPILYDDEIKSLEVMIESLRNSISKIPEIKYYDLELEILENKIGEIKSSIPEVKYYDEDIKSLSENIDLVRKEIPEVKYYDEDISALKEELKSIESTIASLPSVKYYDTDVERLKLNLKETNNKIESIKIPEQVDWSNDIRNLYERIEELNSKTPIEEKDPLTPLEQNFVTFDELKEHYRLFINRVQQQLSSLGGGGETRLEFLDDVDRTSAKTNGYYLKYDATSKKFVGSPVSGGGGGVVGTAGTWGVDLVGINTSKNVGIGTEAKTDYKLYVEGDTRVTGILTVGSQSITLNGSTNEIFVGTGVTIYGNTGTISAINFYGDGTNLSGIITSLVGYSTERYVDTQVGIATIGLASLNYVNNLIGISTFSGNYNDLTNKPTSLSQFSNDVGFVTSSIIDGYSTISYVDNAVAGIISAAPETLDTLNELAAALGDDANFATSVTSSLASKANLSGANFTGIVTSISFDLDYGSIKSISSIKTSTSQDIIDTFDSAIYRSATYDIQITRGSFYHTTKLKILHDGTEVYLTEYETIKTGELLASFSGNIIGGIVRILATPTSTSTTTFKMIRTLIVV